VRGIYDMSAAADKEPKISDTQVQQIVNYALAAKQSPDVKRVACVANILSVFAKNKFDKPAILSARTSSRTVLKFMLLLFFFLPDRLFAFSDCHTACLSPRSCILLFPSPAANLALSSATATLKVDVADALGNPLPSAKVTIKDVRNAKLKSVSSNTPLSKVDGTTYSGNLASAKLERGLYTVTVAVEGSGIIAPASKTIKVRGVS
jgi:hypothetical protein